MSITTKTILKLQYGDFTTCYHETKTGECISLSYGDITKPLPVVRIHSSCLFGESFLSLHCECRNQLEETLKQIKKNGSGVIIYTYAEGRGIGLEKKIKAMEVQRTKNLDTVQAFEFLGLQPDLRTYSTEVTALKELYVNRNIKLVSNNPNKINALNKAGFVIKKIVKLTIKLNEYNSKELITKKTKLGYYID